MEGHSRWVSAVYWRGDTLLTVSADHSIKLWSRSNVQLPASDATVPEEPLMGMRTVGHRLHVLNKSQALTIIDITDPLNLQLHERIPPPPGCAAVNAVAYLHPEGRSWAYANYTSTWSMVVNNVLRERSCGAEVASKFAVWDGEGGQVLSAGDGGMNNTVVHYAADATPRLSPLSTFGWVMDVAWTPDGKRVVQTCQDKTVTTPCNTLGNMVNISPVITRDNR